MKNWFRTKYKEIELEAFILKNCFSSSLSNSFFCRLLSSNPFSKTEQHTIIWNARNVVVERAILDIDNSSIETSKITIDSDRVLNLKNLLLNISSLPVRLERDNFRDGTTYHLEFGLESNIYCLSFNSTSHPNVQQLVQEIESVIKGLKYQSTNQMNYILEYDSEIGILREIKQLKIIYDQE